MDDSVTFTPCSDSFLDNFLASPLQLPVCEPKRMVASLAGIAALGAPVCGCAASAMPPVPCSAVK